MAKTSRFARIDEVHGDISIQECEVPKPEPGRLVIRTELCGVCGTDVHMYHGRLEGMGYPLLIGHEVTGRVDTLGQGVTHDSLGRPVGVGDRIVIVPGVPCGRCYNCAVLKSPTRCTNKHAYGFKNDEDANRLTGGMGQYVYARFPNSHFFKTDLPPEIAVLTEPLAIAVHGIARAGMRLGGTAVVQGTGAIGLGAVIFAHLAGAAKVIAVGGPKRRLELAREFGADVVIDIADIRDPQERIKIVRDETLGGLGADIVFECAGFPEALPEGLSYVRDSGKYVEVGHFTDMGSVEINPHRHFMRKNLDFYACWGSSVEFMAQALQMLDRRDLPFEKLVSHKLPMAKIKDVIDSVSNRTWTLGGNEEIVKVAIDPWM